MKKSAKSNSLSTYNETGIIVPQTTIHVVLVCQKYNVAAPVFTLLLFLTRFRMKEERAGGVEELRQKGESSLKLWNGHDSSGEVQEGIRGRGAPGIKPERVTEEN